MRRYVSVGWAVTKRRWSWPGTGCDPLTFELIRRHFNRRQVLKSAAAGAGVVAAPMLGRLPGASAQGVTLKVLVPQGALADGLIKMAPKFTEETGNTIEVAAFPYESLQEKTVTSDPGAIPEFDMFFADDPWMPNIKPATSAVPLDCRIRLRARP